jgi:twitching motility protein PilT
MAWIDSLFQQMVAAGASDLHMTSGLRPYFRASGDVSPIDGCPELSAEQLRQVLYDITPERNRLEFEECSDTDFAYDVPGLARFRANLFMDRNGPGAVFRQIPSEVLTAQQLNLPKACLDLCMLSKGLVVVTGPTGSGKSTTLAAMIDHINKTAHGPHHHDRGPDRVRAQAAEVPDQPARGAPPHQVLQARAACGAARGPRHRAGGRDA